MKKSFLKAISLIAILFPAMASAQRINFATKVEGPGERPESVVEKMDRYGIFNSIELAANIGTTGLGLEVASPITKWTKLRAGVDWMPPISIPMTFGMESYVDGQVNDKFETIQDLMYQMSGMTLDKEIRMKSTPTMTTFRLMLDIYPFRNRHWHVTAGFFVGGNSIGKSKNIMEEMPSLLAVNMYDRMYKEVTADDYIDKVLDEPFFGDFYLDLEVAMDLQEKMLSMGQLGVHVGDHKDGTPYMMMPDEDGTVSAKAKVNRFRPYVGFGYGGALTPDGKWQVGFDAGIQIWGGVPKVTTHDGTVLNDLVNLRGKVGTYMDLMKAIPVYPTIDFRISYCF
ncbi:MAG: hypothetical protein K2M83_00240 [Muribaculaceae bacterium]|nr:hypothetical protein [Muribaculaceae bacterium]